MALLTACRSEYLDVHGVRYHLRRWGAPQRGRVLALHGWMDTSATFQYLVDAMEAGWEVVAPDWRGFGLSGRQGRPYWFPDYLGDLDAIVQYVFPDEPANIAGHSMGGNIACIYAGVRPEVVRCVATLDGFGLLSPQPDEAPGRLAKWLGELRSGPGQFRSYASLEELASRLSARNARLGVEQARFLAAHLGEVTEDGSVALQADVWHRAVNPVLYRIEEIKACWRAIQAPVLWVEASASEIMDRLVDGREDYLDRLGCIRRVREIRIEDAGHMVHQDQPGLVARHLEAFLHDPDHYVMASGDR